jgi:hypothetical protein
MAKSLGERVGSFLNLRQRNLVNRVSSVLTAVSRDGSSRIEDPSQLPVLAILGAYFNKEIIPHRWLIEALVDPNDEDFDFETSKLRIPLLKACKLILEVGKGDSNVPYP